MLIEPTTDDGTEALARAFQAGNRAHGVDLLGRCARGWLRAGRLDHVARWTQELSRTEILEHETIATAHIATMIFRRRFFEAKQLIEEAEGAWSNASPRSRSRLRTLRLMLAVLSDDGGDDTLLAEVGDGPSDTYLTGALI